MNSKLSLTPQEIENELPPQFWEYKKSPVSYIDSLKFSQDPQLTPNVVEVLGDRNHEDQKHCQQKYEDYCVDRKSRKIKHENTLSKQSMWAKLHAAKALEETANVLCRQGQLDDLEKTLELVGQDEVNNYY